VHRMQVHSSNTQQQCTVEPDVMNSYMANCLLEQYRTAQ
jgi:hypothetical protein